MWTQWGRCVIINYPCSTWPLKSDSWLTTTSHQIFEKSLIYIILVWDGFCLSIFIKTAHFIFRFLHLLLSFTLVRGWTDLENLKLTLTLENNNHFGLQLSTWEITNLKWVATKSPSTFKTLLFIWVNILPFSDVFCWPQLHNLAYIRALQVLEDLEPSKMFVWGKTWLMSLVISCMITFLDFPTFWSFSSRYWSFPMLPWKCGF